VPTWIARSKCLLPRARSLTKLNDTNLQERMETTRRMNEEAANEQSTMLGQMKDSLDEHTRSLQTQGTTAARLAERMYDFFLTLSMTWLIATKSMRALK